jgi:hypothetical protein
MSGAQKGKRSVSGNRGWAQAPMTWNFLLNFAKDNEREVRPERGMKGPEDEVRRRRCKARLGSALAEQKSG